MRFDRRTFVTATTTLAGAAAVITSLGAAGRAASAAAADPDTPAAQAVERLLPGHAGQVTFRTVAREAGADRFRVSGAAGRISVEGTTPAVQLAGLRWYLKHVAHANISWAGEQLDLPDLLPGVPEPIARTANVPHRFAFNDTNDGYTGAYHDWSYWEREIDVLALHGYNEVLVTIGTDAVYHRLFQEFGYGENELREWIPGPAHQPWWLLQNISAFGGPVTRQLLDRRAVLARRIADRLRDLGMTPVFPGYFGTVPPGFTGHDSAARTVPQGEWFGFARPDWLDPRTKSFSRVAAAYYRLHMELLGSSTMYKMDLLHEGGRAGDVPVGDATRAVEAALRTAHPRAVWAILGWQHNPSQAVVEAADTSRLLVLDGLSDRFPRVTDREADWGGTPYAFGSIWNFGGHTAMGANTTDWADLYEAWRAKPGSALQGIALLPEAADNNPAAFELFSELPWTHGHPDLPAWFAGWAKSRYGAADPHAAAAWDVLRRTAYGTSRADSWSEAPDGLFGARPNLDAASAASWSPKDTRYDTAAIEVALDELLAVAPELRGSSAYRYDLLDVARQALSNRSRALLPMVKEAYEAGDRTRFGELTRLWLGDMDQLELLLTTDERHLLGRWIADARSWGASAAEKDRLEYDAVSLLTVWGHRAGSRRLHDYANREWAGLVGGLYRLRWKTYFEALDTALTSGKAPKVPDWYPLEDGWVRGLGTLAARPSGDTFREAGRIRDRLARG